MMNNNAIIKGAFITGIAAIIAAIITVLNTQPPSSLPSSHNHRTTTTGDNSPITIDYSRTTIINPSLSEKPIRVSHKPKVDIEKNNLLIKVSDFQKKLEHAINNSNDELTKLQFQNIQSLLSDLKNHNNTTIRNRLEAAQIEYDKVS